MLPHAVLAPSLASAKPEAVAQKLLKNSKQRMHSRRKAIVKVFVTLAFEEGRNGEKKEQKRKRKDENGRVGERQGQKWTAVSFSRA